jgi:hypothetical protein
MKLRGFQMMMALMVSGFFVLSLSSAFSMGRLRVEIPFSFYVDNKEFPAGEYLVTRGDRGQMLTIKQAEGQEFASVLVQPMESERTLDRNTLSFHKYGNTYFLRNVSSADTSVSGSLFKSKREKTMAAEMAKAKGGETQAVVRLTVPAE